MECLSTEMLCMHFDHELDARIDADVNAHLSTCQRCVDRLQALREDHARLRRVFAGPPAPEVYHHACYSAEDLSAYASGVLTPQEAASIEQHLHTCDICLGEVMALHRTLRLLQRDTLLAPPARLMAAARQGSAGAELPAALEQLGTLIIQVATEGLRFLEAALLPGDVRLTVGGHLLPAAAFRSGQEATQAVAFLEVRQTVRELELQLGALHEARDTVLVKVQLYKRGQPLVRRRVSLWGHGRLLASANTAGHGAVDFSRLAPGEYTIRIPQENVETHVILRSAGETEPA
jgi:anti-sigma factor RsiW